MSFAIPIEFPGKIYSPMGLKVYPNRVRLIRSVPSPYHTSSFNVKCLKNPRDFILTIGSLRTGSLSIESRKNTKVLYIIAKAVI